MTKAITTQALIDTLLKVHDKNAPVFIEDWLGKTAAVTGVEEHQGDVYRKVCIRFEE